MASDPHHTDNLNSQILLERVRFRDSNIGQSNNTVEVPASRLIYPIAVTALTFTNHPNSFRITNGGNAPWYSAGYQIVQGRTQLFFEQADEVAGLGGDGQNCGNTDYSPFSAALLGCLRNNNLNYRVGLENAPPDVNYSYELEFESRIWDSHFMVDTRQELLFFEEQGNSVLAIQAMEGNALIGNEVIVRSVDQVDVRSALFVTTEDPAEIPMPITSQSGRVKLGKVSPDGLIDNQGTWAKFYAMDLNELGVAHLKKLRVRTTNSNGGGNTSAHVKVIAVDTSPAYTAQTMLFD